MQKIIIQGIQFDDKSSYQKGPKLAPPLIRKALNSGSLNLFAENNESAINNYYTTLIESTQGMVEETINKSDDIIVVKKLLEVRTKLNEMKNEKPSLETIDNIIDLKKSFE